MMHIFKHLIFHTDFFVNLLGFNLSLQLWVNKQTKPIETYFPSLWKKQETVKSERFLSKYRKPH